MKRLLTISILLTSCTLSCVVETESTTAPDLDDVYTVQPIPPHTGPSAVTCGQSNNSSLTCPIPGQACRYVPTYQNANTCWTGAQDTSASWVSVDGPEDCAPGQHACSHGVQYTWGERFTTTCQVADCATADGMSSTLCNPNLANTGCAAGQTCVRAGAQPPPPSYPWDTNHPGLLRYMWLCR
jgi:hypothetical protein